MIARLERSHVDVLIDNFVKGVLEAARQNLLLKGNGNQRDLFHIVRFIARHLSKVSFVEECWRTVAQSSSLMNLNFFYALNAKAERTRPASAASGSEDPSQAFC